MFRLVLYGLLSLAINAMVIGEPFWRLATSRLWIALLAAVVVFAVGYQCFDDDSRLFKTFGCVLVIFSIVGVLSFFIVPAIRSMVSGYLGIDNPDALFDFYENLSIMQIFVIAICETILTAFLLPNNKDEAQ